MAKPLKWWALPLGVFSFLLGAILTFGLESGLRMTVQKGLFVIGTQSLLLFGGYLVWRNIKETFKERSRFICQDVAKVAVISLMILGHCNTIAYLYLVQENPHPFSMLSYACFGIYTQFLIAFVFMVNLKWCVQKALGFKVTTTGRTSRIPVAISLIYALAIGVIGFYNSTLPPVMKQIEVPIKGLPYGFDGYKIIQMCDIHLGPTVGRDYLKRAVDMSNKANPDLVVIVGDLVDDSVTSLKDAVAPVKKLKAKHGKYFVTGNHEYYTADVDNWFKHLRTLGFSVLHNSHVNIHEQPHSPDYFCLAGVDDLFADTLRYSKHGMDIEAAVGGCDPYFPTILLAHQPKAAKMALETDHRIDLVLSGHTHGGQFFPMSILVYIVNYPFYAGLYQYNNAHVYVSEGTVYWGIPLRIGSRNEITEIILRKAD